MPETWGTAAATVDLEDGERHVHPFAAVIDEYKRHGEKAVRRDAAAKTTRRTKVSLYYFEKAIQLGEGLLQYRRG